MALSYLRLAKQPLLFLRMTGVKIEEFQTICQRVKLVWEEQVEAKKKCKGRSSKLKTLEDKVLALTIYYRTYITQEFIGYLFDLNKANICRLFKQLEPILAKKITIKKDRRLTPDAIIKLLADVTEQPIQRPKKASKRKKTYSGKKKRHTQKVELIMQEDGKIVSLSRSYPGRIHDFRIRKEETPLPRDNEKYVDLGYQGLQKRTGHVKLPFKRRKNQPLTEEQKAYNRQQASFRMKIEHKIRELKIFKILSNTYRNFGKKHHLRFNVIAGIVNLKHGF